MPLQTSYDEDQTGNIISETPEWLDLVAHVQDIEKVHLKDLLQDEARTDELSMESDGVYADFSRQRVTSETVQVLPVPCTVPPAECRPSAHSEVVGGSFTPSSGGILSTNPMLKLKCTSTGCQVVLVASQWC